MHRCAGQQQIPSRGWGTALGTAGTLEAVVGCKDDPLQPVSTQSRGHGTAQGWPGLDSPPLPGQFALRHLNAPFRAVLNALVLAH